MDQATVVAEDAVGAHQHVVGNGVAEHLNTESVGYYFFSLFVQVGVDQGNVIIAGDAVAQC